MFERFTEGARKTVVLAHEESRRFNHPYVGTEHLLLGLIRGGGSEANFVSFAATVLGEQGITLDAARKEVEEVVGLGEEVDYEVPFTPRVKKAFELALREALQLHHNYIGTEHLLLGLLRQDGSAADRVLMGGLGVSRDHLRREVIRALKEPGEG
jgi:ATP-dependent Clp protease ATP-binding subunit ClpC